MSRRSPQLQRLLVLLKTQKTNSPASDWWKCNKYCFKENAKIFSKNCITQEKFRISKSKKVYEIYTKKKNFKPKIKSMIENLQTGLYQLDKTQAKGAKLRANIRQ